MPNPILVVSAAKMRHKRCSSEFLYFYGNIRVEETYPKEIIATAWPSKNLTFHPPEHGDILHKLLVTNI
ncbi:MAG: hypothetical protein ACRD8Z_13255 [Nitrososphaeraceae archaeon]